MSQIENKGQVDGVDPKFVELACSWMQNFSMQFIGFVWSAYETWRQHPPQVDPGDLERSITQLLEPRVRDVMTGDEPFYIQHGPYERETMKPPPAQPPEYDLAYVFRADERIMWPMEAKVLETPKKVDAYIQDINNEFLTCRYAPFSNSGAMLGYLLSGDPGNAFDEINEKLGCPLEPILDYPDNPNRLSQHHRNVPNGKPYPVEFGCYHLILEFPGLQRSN